MSYSSAYDAHLDNYGDPDPSGENDQRDFAEEAYNQGILDTGDGEIEFAAGSPIDHSECVRTSRKILRFRGGFSRAHTHEDQKGFWLFPDQAGEE